MKNMKNNFWVLGFVFLMLIFGVGFVNAQENTQVYYGFAYIGGVSAPDGTHVEVYSGSGEFLADWNVSGAAGNYSLTITVTNETNPSDNKAVTGENLTFKLNGVVAYTPAPGSEVITAQYGGFPVVKPNVDINTTPSCTDGVKNGDEEMVDCGGSCTPCLSLTLYPTTTQSSPHTETFTSDYELVNGSDVFTLYVNNTGYHEIYNIVLTPATCNFTVSLSKNNISKLTGTGKGNTTLGGEGFAIIVNKTFTNLSYGEYYCNITVSSDNTSSKVFYMKITVSSSITTTTYVRRRFFSLSYTPETPSAGQCIKLLVKDKTTDDPVKEADVDIYLNGIKLFYGLTGADGTFEFCPTKPGSYEVEVDKTRYKQETIRISVIGVAVTTTPVKTVVTTTLPIPTTPEGEIELTTPVETPRRTTTPAETPVVTTPEVKPTTPAPVTTIPPVQPKGMDTLWLIIVIIVIIVLVVVYLMTKKKEEKPVEKKKKEAKPESE